MTNPQTLSRPLWDPKAHLQAGTTWERWGCERNPGTGLTLRSAKLVMPQPTESIWAKRGKLVVSYEASAACVQVSGKQTCTIPGSGTGMRQPFPRATYIWGLCSLGHPLQQTHCSDWLLYSCVSATFPTQVTCKDCLVINKDTVWSSTSPRYQAKW